MFDQLVNPAITPTEPYKNGFDGVVIPPINYTLIETEDDTPVDNLFSAKQQRLLVESLYSSWTPGFSFLADANVGVFRSPDLPPIVPDMFLSLRVQVAENWYAKEHRSYFIWQFGKPPELCVEIISNLKGGELKQKLERYADLRVNYYVIFDPQAILVREKLRIFELRGGGYSRKSSTKLNGLGLSLQLWRGVYEQKEEEWLRWGDVQGQLIPTGFERAEWEAQRAEREAQRAEQEAQRAKQEAQRAEREAQRAEQEAQRAEWEAQRANRLEAMLLAMGIDPEKLL